MEELIPVGPFAVAVRLPEDVAGRSVRSLVDDAPVAAERRDGWIRFPVTSILGHAVFAIE